MTTVSTFSNDCNFSEKSRKKKTKKLPSFSFVTGDFTLKPKSREFCAVYVSMHLPFCPLVGLRQRVSRLCTRMCQVRYSCWLFHRF